MKLTKMTVLIAESVKIGLLIAIVAGLARIGG